MSYQNITQKGNCVWGHNLLKLGGAYRLVSPYIKVNFLIESIPLKLLLDWNQPLLNCLAIRRNFSALEKCEKL